jgi:hypothetical protein
MITQDTTAATRAWGSSSAAGTQDGFTEAVLAVAARAKAALPEAARRIDTAAALVLAGEVELLDEGRMARVGPDGDTVAVGHGQCSARSFPPLRGTCARTASRIVLPSGPRRAARHTRRP